VDFDLVSSLGYEFNDEAGTLIFIFIQKVDIRKRIRIYGLDARRMLIYNSPAFLISIFLLFLKI
jgi:hypothetical protein